MKKTKQNLLTAGLALYMVCGVKAATVSDTWPRVTITNGNRIVIYQPQLQSWTSNVLNARAVVEVTLQWDTQSRLGVAWFTASTSVDSVNRMVTLQNLNVSKVQFSAIANQEANMRDVLRSAIPHGTRTIALDRLVTASMAAQHQANHANASLKNDPPIVIWTTNAVAALVLIDGDPVLKPVQNSSLMRVINTAALILFDPSGGTYYLQGEGLWFRSEGIAGPWTVTANPPASVTAIAPPSTAANAFNANAGAPVVFVSTKPADLLHTTGAPAYKTEDGSGLMYVANTDSQVLYDPLGGTAYLLLSGRWFSSQGSLTGPWTHIPAKNVPQSFSQISPGGPKGVVLSSVPGTPQAAAARVANSIPQTATISRSGSSFQVQYDGAPQLKPIDGTDLQYVVNASDPVILCQNQFYAVGNAVWFVSNSPNGPWTVATSVPQDIYTIPSSSPLYYVTFVYVAYADDNQVEVAYTPGYTGSYDSDDSGSGPVYGTGYYYTPWIGDSYYGWGWPYGYGYQYRWWQTGWLWRPPWSQVGNLYARNARNIYDNWPSDGASPYLRQARRDADRALGYGYPSGYGRFAGAIRAAAMAIPRQATLVDPYATRPRTATGAGEVKGSQSLVNSVRVGSAASRDLYASPSGEIYSRRDGSWYKAQPDGKWGYVAPATGPATHPYHPQTVANYNNPAAYRAPTAAMSAAATASDYRPEATQALDQDYAARAAAERSYQDYHPEYRGRR